jgi:hypothetical protein
MDGYVIYQIHDVSIRWLAKHIRMTHYQENKEQVLTVLQVLQLLGNLSVGFRGTQRETRIIMYQRSYILSTTRQKRLGYTLSVTLRLLSLYDAIPSYVGKEVDMVGLDYPSSFTSHIEHRYKSISTEFCTEHL